MSAKIDSAPLIESSPVQATIMNTSSSAAVSRPKMSMFGAKSGFVIPKNKLLGSLVPTIRGGKKQASSDAANEETTSQVQRKTKWGPDLTQDASVRKGRALAYQTRVDQITRQLNMGILEINEDNNSRLGSQASDDGTSVPHTDIEKSKLLELERREVIGEIINLNPSYKAPSDYKPLLKDAKVPIPVKKYPGYNFIGLIFGPGADTQKRLEKETGARIRVYGIKAETGEKVEITSLDGNEIKSSYDELYVQVSAETFGKVDAAVALIELLVTPVSGKSAFVPSTSVSDDVTNVLTQNQNTSSMVQPVVGHAEPAPQGQLPPYSNEWLSTGSPQSQLRPSSFTPPLNPSPPILSNPVHFSSPLNRPSMPSLFGPRPAAANFSPGTQSPSLVPSGPQIHPLGQTGPSRNPPSMLGPQPLRPAQPINSAPPPVTIHQSAPTGPPPVTFLPWLSNTQKLSSVNQPVTSQIYASGPPSQVGSTPRITASSSLPSSFTSIRPPSSFTAPNSSHFTFQPHQPQNPTFQRVLGSNSQPVAQNILPPRLVTQPPLAPQVSSRPQFGNQMGHHQQTQMSSVPFAANPTAMSVPSRLPVFQNTGPVNHTAPVPQVGPRNFSPVPQMPNLAGPFTLRPGVTVQFHQNHLPQQMPNQRFGNNSSLPTYDPFLPTSVPRGPQQLGNNAAKMRKLENDPEYEDLMASVGVK